jgi:hypothetical protein
MTDNGDVFKFYRGDPVATFLIDKLRLTPVTLALFWTTIVVLVGLITASISGSLFSNAEQMGLIQDWIWWVWSLLITPVMSGYYLWSSNSLGELIRTLQQSDVLTFGEDTIRKIEDVFQKPWRKFLAFPIMVTTGVLFFVSRGEFSGFATSSIATRLGTSITYSVLSFFGSMLVFNLLLNVWLIRDFMKDKPLNINPLHPDRSGGLKALSDYSIKVIYLIAIFGLAWGVESFRLIAAGYDWAVVLGILFYVVVAILSFFAPLSTAHEEMEKAKTKLLKKLGKQFWDDYLLAQDAIQGEYETLKDEIGKIKQLRELYDLTSEFPVWPFDIKTVRRFFVTITTPIIPPLIGIILDILF